MLYVYIASALAALWFFRRVIMSPWATYVRHTLVKSPSEKKQEAIAAYLLTVKRIHFYPPFASYEEVWASHDGKTWAREGDGKQEGETRTERSGFVLYSRRSRALTNMMAVARIRELETDAVLKDSP